MHRPLLTTCKSVSDRCLWLLVVEAPVIIVTGGGRGIGKAIATALGATGAKVSLDQTRSRTIHRLFSIVPPHATVHVAHALAH